MIVQLLSDLFMLEEKLLLVKYCPFIHFFYSSSLIDIFYLGT